MMACPSGVQSRVCSGVTVNSESYRSRAPRKASNASVIVLERSKGFVLWLRT